MHVAQGRRGSELRGPYLSKTLSHYGNRRDEFFPGLNVDEIHEMSVMSEDEDEITRF